MRTIEKNWRAIAWTLAGLSLLLAELLAFNLVASRPVPEKLPDGTPRAVINARKELIAEDWSRVEAITDPLKKLPALDRHDRMVDTLPDSELMTHAICWELAKFFNPRFEIVDATFQGDDLAVVDVLLPDSPFRNVHRMLIVRTAKPGYERFRVVHESLLTNEHIAARRAAGFAD